MELKTYKYKDEVILDKLSLPTNVNLDYHKAEQIKRFAVFILQHKPHSLTSREIRSTPAYFSPVVSVIHTTELNVFTNDELKEFVRDLKKEWARKLVDYGQSTL